MLPDSRLIRACAYLPAKVYQMIVGLRIALYEQSYIKPKQLSKVVISVGNITVGGTGKTPIVEFIASYLSEENMEVAILTRGYKRIDSSRRQVVVSDGISVKAGFEEAGDEPFMLAAKLKNVKVIVNSNRFEAGHFAINEFGSDLLLLDDGFQHMQLRRDLNLLVLDATDLFGGGEIVPFGRLREPIYSIKRADAIIVTRSDREFDRDLLFNVLDGLGVNVPIIYSYHELTGLHDLFSKKPVAIRTLNRAKAGIVCAIGNPDLFVEDLQLYRTEIVSKQVFRDHHQYTQTDIDKVVNLASSSGASFLITTEKDAVKMEKFSFGEMPVYVTEIKAKFEDEVRFKSLLLKTIVKKRKVER
ncbi:MAG: tetraacyldisaccharide 4'-kinase [Blastocatellia bacterium]|nr:tetraacyldisaccharide 4'-kinase [Blastocatellia bacterium]